MGRRTILGLILCAGVCAQDCPFQLVAGPPVGGTLEGIPANQAWLQGPAGTAIDASGNLYVAATHDNRILRVGADNIIHVVAGSAQLLRPIFVLAAADGTLYISDTGNNRILRLMQDGTVAQVAGTGHPGFSGDGAGALQAELSGPTGLALDAKGNLYIADTGNNRIRRVNANGSIVTVAGTDPSCSYCLYAGDGGQATAATLSAPGGLAVGPDGSMYIADSGNNVIRRVGPDGVIKTIAGGGQSDTYPVAALSVSLGFPGNVILEADGSLLIAGGPILKLSADGSTVSFVFNGATNGYISQDSQGQIYVGGVFGGDVIGRTSGSSTLLQPVVGQFRSGKGPEGGSAIGAVLNNPQGMAVASDGTVYVADLGNRRVAKISIDGAIRTVAAINYPLRVALGPSGAIYVIDNGLLVRKIAADGTISVFAGGGTAQPPQVGQGSIPATSVSLRNTYGVAIDAKENVYLEITCPTGVKPACQRYSFGSYSWIDVVVKITPDGQMTTIYDPNPTYIQSIGFVQPPVISDFHGLALDAAGNLLVGTDTGVTEIDLTGISTEKTFPTIYGQPLVSTSIFSNGAGGDLAASATGSVFITGDLVSAGDYLGEDFQIQELAPSRFQTIYNDSFTDYEGFLNVEDPPLAPAQLAADSQGNLYVSEKYLHRIRMAPAGSCPSSTGPMIAAVSSASTPSVALQTFAPGQLVTIYGSFLGPTSPARRDAGCEWAGDYHFGRRAGVVQWCSRSDPLHEQLAN